MHRGAAHRPSVQHRSAQTQLCLEPQGSLLCLSTSFCLHWIWNYAFYLPASNVFIFAYKPTLPFLVTTAWPWQPGYLEGLLHEVECLWWGLLLFVFGAHKVPFPGPPRDELDVPFVSISSPITVPMGFFFPLLFLKLEKQITMETSKACSEGFSYFLLVCFKRCIAVRALSRL